MLYSNMERNMLIFPCIQTLKMNSPHYSSAFLFTRLGYLYCVEIETAFVYFSARVSRLPPTHAALARDGNVIALYPDGKMYKFDLNQANIVDFIATKCDNPQVAIKVATAAGLQISDDLINQQFDKLLQMGYYAEAAHFAIKSPGDALRNQATIENLRRIPNGIGGVLPLHQYFTVILDNTKLNEVESIELCKIMLQQNKINFIEKWIKEDKLTLTEELGDLCKQDPRIALAIYLRANVSSKIVVSFAELGMFDQLQAYCQKYAYQPNWIHVATIFARQNPEKIGPVLTYIANNGNPLVDPKELVQMLLQFQLIKDATSFLISVLPQDREEDSELQTLLFEIALNNAPKLAEDLFSRNCFSYYDRQRVAALCQKLGIGILNNNTKAPKSEDDTNELLKRIEDQSLEISSLKKKLSDSERIIKELKKTRQEKNETVYLDQIRFLEQHLGRYEQIQPFDILNAKTHRHPDDSFVSERKRERKAAIFFGDEDEEHQKVLKKIGEGATSVAYKVIDDRTSEVICKKVLKNVDDENVFKKLQNSMKEIETLLGIDHPCICQAIGFNSREKVQPNDEYDDNDEYDNDERQEKTTVALFLEYLPYKLKDYLKSEIMNSTLKTKIAIEVAFGMMRLHELGMIHRDLKIENIMLNSILEAKIIDFDLVHVDDDEREDSLTKGIGTFEYMSPEMLNSENYDNKTDVYSYGIVLFALFVGRLPKQSIRDKMEKKELDFPSRSLMTSNCVELIKMCTSFEAGKRPSFSEIIKFIESKSFRLAKEVDVDSVKSRFQTLSVIEEDFKQSQMKNDVENNPKMTL